MTKYYTIDRDSFVKVVWNGDNITAIESVDSSEKATHIVTNAWFIDDGETFGLTFEAVEDER